MTDSNKTPDTNDFDPVAQLRDEDPARDVFPSDGFMARVLSEAGVTPSSSPSAVVEDEGTSAEVIDLQAERSRRRPVFAWVASAAALALVGSAGYALGAMNDRPVNTAGAEAQSESAATALAMEQAGGFGPQADASAAQRDMAYYGGQYRFTSSGLGQQGGTAPVYAMQAPPMDDARASEIAGIFGVTEPLTADEYGWNYWGDKSMTTSFGVSKDPLYNINFYDPVASPSNDCYGLSTAAVEEGSPDGVQSAYATEWEVDQAEIDQCLTDAMNVAPSGDAAAAKLTEIMTSLGVDMSMYQITGRDQSEIWADGSNATAYLTVDGNLMPIGFDLTLSNKGLVSFNGSLGIPVSVGDYSIVSPQAAFDRLSDPAFGATGGWPWALAAREDQAAGDAAMTSGSARDDMGALESLPDIQVLENDILPQSGVIEIPQSEMPQSESPVVPGPVVPENPQSMGPAAPTEVPDHPLIPWPVQDVYITSASIVYSMVWTSDNGTLLAPYYSFTDSNGGTWTAIAVADEELDFSVPQSG